jgi:cytochrome b561
MALSNSERRWGSVAQTLHWVIAALIVVQFTLALLADRAGELKREHPAAALEQLALLARHKSFGITILGLALIRLVWRATSPVPRMPRTMPLWQVGAARISHFLLYGFLFALPITGWIMSSASNYPVSWFGLVKLPDLVAPDRALHETFVEVHHFLAWSLLTIASLHVLAALKHHFFDRDDVLKRMLPWTG